MSRRLILAILLSAVPAALCTTTCVAQADDPKVRPSRHPLFADGHGLRGAAWEAPAPTPTLGELHGVAALAAPRVDMPLQDNGFFLAEDELRAEPGMRQRFAVGLPLALEIDDGEWLKVDGGRLWRVLIGSANATTARAHLGGIALGEGEEIRLSSPGFPEATIGPIVGTGMFGTGDAWSAATPTADVLIEWFVPEDRRVRALPFGAVSYCHGYRDIFAAGAAAEGGVAGNCHNAPACDPQWQNESNATIFLNFISGGSGYSCSGQLTATSAADETPYVSTANHCIATAAEANSCDFRFFYRASTCGGFSSLGQLVTTGALVSTHAPSDATLLMVLGALPGAPPLGWSGWTAEYPGNGTGAVGIHHPGGAPQTISFGVKNGGSFNCAIAPSGNFHSISWNNGITEPGSSGSAIYRESDRRMFGVLSCGASACSFPDGDDGYGRWDLAVNAGGFGALLAAGSDDGYEPNDSCFEASGAISGATGALSGLVVKRLDEDWYAIPLPPGSRLDLSANYIRSHGALALALFDACGGSIMATGVENPQGSQLTSVNGVPSETVYLRVRLTGSTRLAYGLSWTISNPPAINDSCAAGKTAFLGSTLVNTTSATGSDPAPTSCLEANGTTIGNDVWFRWTPTASGTATASTCGPSWGNLGGGLDTAIAVYEGAAVCDPAVAPIACNDNDPFCGGVVTASGLNTSGQSNIPPTLGAVKAIAAGAAHSVAIDANDLVRCWGSNASLQCTVPGTVGAAKAVGAGADHSAAVRTDGKVICWGSNQYNQRVPPATLVGVAAIACGAYHNIALRSDGSLAGWGNNQFSQSTVPAVLDGVVVKAIAAGGYHSVALRADGTVHSWGWGLLGQSPTPNGVANITHIAAGFGHTVAMKANGDFIGWGANDDLQAQTGSFLRPMIALSAGQFHTIGVSATGTVQCLGSNSSGQCPGSTSPIVDLGISGRVAAGGSHNLFLSCNDFPVCETGSTVSWPAVAGVTYSIRVGSPTGEKGVANLQLSIDTPQCAGDINASGAVDSADLAAIFGSWGPCADCTADIDRSGVVNGDDLAILLAGWGPC